MDITVRTWDGHLALTIPEELARRSHIREGSVIHLTVEHGRLVIESPGQSSAARLDDMLARVTDENRHAEVSIGGPVGNEAL